MEAQRIQVFTVFGLTDHAVANHFPDAGKMVAPAFRSRAADHFVDVNRMIELGFGSPVSDQFVGVNKMVGLGKIAQCEIDDVNGRVGKATLKNSDRLERDE